jgi:tricorn protease
MPNRLPLFALVAVAGPAFAQDPIRFARTPAVSPDGKLVAFSYLGDLWTVETIGGVARPVTMHEAHDFAPCFSPDGRSLAFASSRHGGYDVFVVPVHGGKPRRLTFDSAQDVPTGWTPDGKGVVFTSDRSPEFPKGQGVYVVPAAGGQERRLPLFEGKEAHYSPDGKHLAYVRGPGTWYRRGYRGSSNDDLYLANADGSNPVKLTAFDGQDTAPMWGPDGKTLYYVTERDTKDGSANVVRQEFKAGPKGELVADGPPKAVTQHTADPVRRARISGDGSRIVYECGADLWAVDTRGGSSRLIPIEAHADDKSNTETTTTFTTGATDYAVSPDESHVVVVVHGELFLQKVAGGKAVKLTDDPAFDHAPAWHPDGKRLVFVSDRSGTDELYALDADDGDEEFTKANKFKVKKLTTGTGDVSGATVSPKKDRIAYLRAGKLWSVLPDGTGEKVLVNDTKVVDYDWSPDGKWVAFARLDGSFASELYVVPADGSAAPKNVTRYATTNGDVTWSQTGNKLGFLSHRRGSTAMHVLDLRKPSAGASGFRSRSDTEIDWDDIHQRVSRPANMSADHGAISPDGSQVAFRSGDALWVAAADGGSLNRVTAGGQSPRDIKWSRKTTGQIYFLNGSGELRTARAGGGFAAFASRLGSESSVGEPGKVAFKATLTVRRDEEFAEMFAQCWRALADQFYDLKFHGADWAAVREKYRPLVSHVAQKEDLYALVSLMLGELNASHLGIGGKLPSADEPTPDLGLIFDDNYAGPGLKVAEVIKRGPADKRGLGISAGDIVLSVDRTELTDKTNLSRLLNNKVNEAVTLGVTSDPKDPKAKRTVEVTATDRGKVSNLMYERWVEANADRLTKLSGGRLGYIHIPSMDEAGLEAFVRALYSDNFDKEALVLDVRYNGGGFTHDQVLAYLTGKEHTVFRQRNGGEGLVMRNYDRKWTKPAVVLINNRSYSDAEIFPHAFRAVGAGKVVGQATGGCVIGTGRTLLIDGSEFRLPRVGVFTTGGVNMEKEGVRPDVAVDLDPADWAKGIDTQLVKAAEVVQRDVVAWKKAKAAAVASEAKPADAEPATAGGGSAAKPAGTEGR